MMDKLMANSGSWWLNGNICHVYKSFSRNQEIQQICFRKNCWKNSENWFSGCAGEMKTDESFDE